MESDENGVEGIVMKLRLATKSEHDSRLLSDRMSSLVHSGLLSQCMHRHCMPRTVKGAEMGKRLRVHLRNQRDFFDISRDYRDELVPGEIGREDGVVFQAPQLETNMARPLIEQPLHLQLLSLPAFMCMLRDFDIRSVCDATCSVKHFGARCRICFREYADHDGHTCPSSEEYGTGEPRRGCFEVDGAPTIEDAKRLLYAMAGRGLRTAAQEAQAKRLDDEALRERVQRENDDGAILDEIRDVVEFVISATIAAATPSPDAATNIGVHREESAVGTGTSMKIVQASTTGAHDAGGLITHGHTAAPTMTTAAPVPRSAAPASKEATARGEGVVASEAKGQTVAQALEDTKLSARQRRFAAAKVQRGKTPPHVAVYMFSKCTDMLR